jgi:hypothetical protein
MNMKGPGSDHWGTPCFNVPQSVKNYWFISSDFISTFCYLNRTCMNLHLLLECHRNVTQLTIFHDLHSKKPLPNHEVPPTCIIWLTDLHAPFVSLKAAFSVDIPSQNHAALRPVSY